MSTVIQHTIEPVAGSVGSFPIGRYLPSRTRQMVGPFIFMDLGGPIEVPAAMEGGAPEHPHAGLSTFTYLMQGSVHHTESAAKRAQDERGDVTLTTPARRHPHDAPTPADRRLGEPRRAALAHTQLALSAAQHHTSRDLPYAHRGER